MTDLDILDIITILKCQADAIGSQKALAKKIGITPQYLNNVINFRQDPGPIILEYLGVEKVVSYKGREEHGT